MPSPAASPIPTWLLLVLMTIGAKRQRVDRRGSEAAGDGDECQGRDGDGCPFSTADYRQRRQSNDVGNGLKRYCNRCSKNKNPCFTGTNQYGAGGWEAQPREVWAMIRLKPIGSASTTSSSSRKR